MSKSKARTIDRSVQVLIALLGVMGAVAGAFGGAWIGSTQEAAMKERERVHTRIENVYFVGGLYPVEQGLSTYGVALATGILDVRLWVTRTSGKLDETQILIEEMNKIRMRESVADLLSRDYRLISQSIPRLNRFESQFINAIKTTLYSWSRFLEDMTDVSIIQADIKEAGKERFLSGAWNATLIFQRTETYLETRIRQLDDYVWRREYHSYVDFLEIVDEPCFRQFKSELFEYTVLLSTFMDSMGEEEKLASASYQLDYWLFHHIEMNPFGD